MKNNEGQNLYNELKKILIDSAVILKSNDANEYKYSIIAIDESHLKIAQAAHLLINSNNSITENDITITNSIQGLLSSDAAHKFNKVLNETDIHELLTNNELWTKTPDLVKQYNSYKLSNTLYPTHHTLEDYIEHDDQISNSNESDGNILDTLFTENFENKEEESNNIDDNDFSITQNLQEAKNNLINKKALTDKEAATKIQRAVRRKQNNRLENVKMTDLTEDLKTIREVDERTSTKVKNKEIELKEELRNKARELIDNVEEHKKNISILENDIKTVKSIKTTGAKNIAPIKINEPTKPESTKSGQRLESFFGKKIKEAREFAINGTNQGKPGNQQGK